MKPIIIICALVMLAACNVDDYVDPNEFSAAKVIRLEIDNSHKLCEPASHIFDIYAAIAATAGRKPVTFRTTLGVFELTAKDELTAYTDSLSPGGLERIAHARIRVDSTGSGFVSATIDTYTVYGSISD